MTSDIPGAREMMQRAVASAGADMRVRQKLALIYALSGDLAQAEALTLRDLSPDAARETLAYYRELGARAQSRPPETTRSARHQDCAATVASAAAERLGHPDDRRRDPHPEPLRQ